MAGGDLLRHAQLVSLKAFDSPKVAGFTGQDEDIILFGGPEAVEGNRQSAGCMPRQPWGAPLGLDVLLNKPAYDGPIFVAGIGRLCGGAYIGMPTEPEGGS